MGSSSSGPLDVTAEQIWHALRRHEIVPYYQPKVSLKCRHVKGVEALMRWSSPEHGVICASSLLPFLRDQVLAEEVSLCIIELSLSDYRRWRDVGLDLQLCINLPAELLKDSDVALFMASQARGHGVEPSRIVIEVPEIAFASCPPEELDRLVDVRVQGFGLSVDDFGAGSCTREQLERIPASEMKVDRAVLTLAMRNGSAHERLHQVLGIAREMNIDTVMEGVETLAEWEFAAALNCDYAQGYFIAAPMQGDRFVDWSRAADALHAEGKVPIA